MRRNPIDEQLAQVLEIMLNDEPENNEEVPPPIIFSPFKFLNTYTFMLITTPRSTVVILEIMKDSMASLDR
jgi:hypothetical protein